ncbi:unnamed protein product, partial [Mesorhabditis spiculigera]
MRWEKPEASLASFTFKLGQPLEPHQAEIKPQTTNIDFALQKMSRGPKVEKIRENPLQNGRETNFDLEVAIGGRERVEATSARLPKPNFHTATWRTVEIGRPLEEELDLNIRLEDETATVARIAPEIYKLVGMIFGLKEPSYEEIDSAAKILTKNG